MSRPAISLCKMVQHLNSASLVHEANLCYNYGTQYLQLHSSYIMEIFILMSVRTHNYYWTLLAYVSLNVSRIIVQHMEDFKGQAKQVTRHIPSKYTKEMATTHPQLMVAVKFGSGADFGGGYSDNKARLTRSFAAYA